VELEVQVELEELLAQAEQAEQVELEVHQELQE
jgi:hypothetical protein